jgi:hypothetical protein
MTEFQSLILKAINAALLGKKIVVKRKGNKFYLAEVPIDKIDRVPTMAQKKQLHRFSAAALYAREAVGNAELEKMYKSKGTYGRSAFNRAFTDFLKPPEVRRIDTTRYTGAPGSVIGIKAMDDFHIKTVEVSIFDAEGNLIEKDKATLDPVFRIKWMYTSTRQIENLQGCKIKAFATDLAGNIGEKEITL